MKRDIKDRWVAALESGEYSQATGALTDGQGFCCLGVLCEIAVADGVIAKEDRSYYNPDTSDGKLYYEDAELPELVMNWAGVTSANPYTHIDVPADKPSFNDKASYSELNDDMGYDFHQIADVIRNDPNL